MKLMLLGSTAVFLTMSSRASVVTEISSKSKGSQIQVACSASNSNSNSKTAELSSVYIIPRGESFDVVATSGESILFRTESQRPSLNARIEDGPTDAVNEFIDFNNSGLESIPVDGKNKLEFDLKHDSTVLHYTNDTLKLELKCQINPERLLARLGIRPRPQVPFHGVKAVAFDIDDTLMFTSPAFVRAFKTGGAPKPNDVLFWTHVNGCDGGCQETTIKLSDGSSKVLPANVPSSPKQKAIELIKYHKSLGHRIYAITARPDINGDPLREYLESQMGIAREDLYFEPDLDQPGNPAGKTDRIESLNLDVFYGDSDSDITDTLKAFVDSKTGVRSKKVEPVRFLRSPKSSNRKSGELNKYHPGYFGEPILSESY